MKKLASSGIGTQVHYIPVPMQPYYEELGYSIKNYPRAESYYSEALSIPIYYELTDEEQASVIEAILSEVD